MTARVRILHGDCLELLPGLEPESIDAVITDPPYDLLSGPRKGSGRSNEPDNPYGRHGANGGGFMGLSWDATGVAFDPETWRVVLRVLKPGAHLVAFGGSRTFHRMTCAIEDAGFEIRDVLTWLYGSGFPKSKNLPGGIGTALKPAWEPIVLARKPFNGTVAANVEQYGTGALNIDGCRIEGGMDDTPESWAAKGAGGKAGANGFAGQFSQGMKDAYARGDIPLPSGRWPANLILDEEAAAALDAEVGRTSTTGKRSQRSQERDVPGTAWGNTNHRSIEYPSDSGGPSRFFFCAKSSRTERNAGLAGMPDIERGQRYGNVQDARPHTPDGYEYPRAVTKNHHPTVKPVALMRWLVRLVTPPAGVVLDPFAGSGTTGVSCVFEERDCLLIEREAAYIEIARRRVAHAQGPLFVAVAD